MIGLVPYVVGALAVLQGNLNRAVAQQHGLALAMAINTAVFAVATVALVGLVRARPEWFPASFALRLEGYRFLPWHLVPGLCGLSLVAGIPWAMSSLGPVRVFVGVVVAQVAASVLWEAVIEGHPPTPVRLVGVALALVGVVLASLR